MVTLEMISGVSAVRSQSRIRNFGMSGCLVHHTARVAAAGDEASGGLLATSDNFTAPLACPVCTARALCENLGAFGWQYGEWIERQAPDMCDKQPIPWPENEAFTAHGGTGTPPPPSPQTHPHIHPTTAPLHSW